MKRQTEWAVIAALILFMSFTPGFAPVRTLLSMPLGRLAALAAIVYVYKSVSPVIALLLAIHVARCTRMGGVWEGVDETLAEPTEMCECDGGFTYNSGTKMCEKPGVDSKKPLRCSCVPGEEWNAEEKKCKTKKVEQAPPPQPPPEPIAPTGTAADLAAVEAQAASAPPSSVPQTTGSAAATLAASAPPPTAPPVPEKFTPNEAVTTRGNLYSPW